MSVTGIAGHSLLLDGLTLIVIAKMRARRHAAVMVRDIVSGVFQHD